MEMDVADRPAVYLAFRVGDQRVDRQGVRPDFFGNVQAADKRRNIRKG